MNHVVSTDASPGRRRPVRRSAAALVALLLPGLMFPICLFLIRNDPRFLWLHQIRTYPWEFWMIAVCGTTATVGGVLDWRFHRSGETVVGNREHRAHLMALAGGGAPMFFLMAAASVSLQPAMYLMPVLIVLIYTVIMICYDEFVFHRRCQSYETLTHRLLTFGNGLAFLAWAHWCFVRNVGMP